MCIDDVQQLRVDAEQAASKVLTPLGLATPEELRDALWDIAAFRGADVRETPLDGLSGRLVRKRSRSIITVNSRDGIGRRRFSIGHELGHHEMHHRLDQTFACTSADMQDYRSSSAERQANHFAANLLMPRGMFLRALGEQRPSIALANTVRTRFGASLMATAIRLVEMTDERAAVVVSTVNGVSWAIRNRHFGFAIDRRIPKLSEYSYAYDVLRGKPDQERPSFVDGDTWLYFDLHPGLALYESSVSLGQFGLALTVLWIREE